MEEARVYHLLQLSTPVLSTHLIPTLSTPTWSVLMQMNPPLVDVRIELKRWRHITCGLIYFILR